MTKAESGLPTLVGMVAAYERGDLDDMGYLYKQAIDGQEVDKVVGSSVVLINCLAGYISELTGLDRNSVISTMALSAAS